MSSYNIDITEAYLDRFYQDIHQEQMKLMTDYKGGSNDLAKEKYIQQQITLMNNLMMSCMRLRNIRKRNGNEN